MEGAGDGRSIRPAKGVHVTVPWELVRNDIAAVIPVPGDKRSLFVVPWGACPDGTFAHTYIGTTDTDYDGPLDDPPCTGDDIDYVLGALNAALDPARRADHADDHRRVGRAAAARALGRQRPHRRPVAPASRRRRPGWGGEHRRGQAHDLPRDGRGHGRHRARHDSAARAAAAPARCCCAAPTATSTRRRAPATPTWPTATGRVAAPSMRSSPPTPRSAHRWSRACRTRAPRRCTPSAPRWPPRSPTC